MGLYDDVTKEAAELVKAAYNGTKRNGSNKAINAIANNGFGGLEMVGRAFRGEGMGAIKNTFADEAGKWNAGKIAGSYLGAAAAGRVLTGGGVYKDGNGSTNLVGVPFV